MAQQQPNKSQIAWSSITPSPAYLEKLLLFCHSQTELKKEGYVLQPLNPAQIEAKLRCMKCGKRTSRRPPPKAVLTTDVVNQKKKQNDSKSANIKDASTEEPSVTSTTASNKNKKCSNACKYHTGGVRDKRFTCCGRHVAEEGCTEDPEHSLPPKTDPFFLEYWQYYSTPAPIPTKPTVFPAQTASRKSKSKQKSKQPTAITMNDYLQAIALDCEMGTSKTSESELIRLTAVDFFTGAILIDNLVQPSVPMAHYNTRYSGVTANDMRQAVRNGTAILGRDRARLALLQYVGPETVVVVHGGSSDFSALRWIHPLIVDTFILEGYFGVKVEGGKNLQNLCKLKLGIDVQVRDRSRGILGHDSYEDAMATRELVVQWAKSIPDT